MPKRISKEEEETFFFDPRDSGGLEIRSEGGIPLELMDFYKSLLPDEKKIKPSTTKLRELTKAEKDKKKYKESNLMKGRSDLKKKGDKYTVDTELNIKKGLDGKVKKALKKSVIQELDKKIEGSGLKKIELDLSDDEKPKRRGRPKKGKGFDSSSDEDEFDNYKKILTHLMEHILDKKEKVDIKDFNQAKLLIDKIKSLK